MSDLGFDGKVAIIPGAGGGLGREHALLMARRGALIVVNDLGGAVDGTGSDKGAAQLVVDEIVAAGGEAVANSDSVATVEGGVAIVKCRPARCSLARTASPTALPSPTTKLITPAGSPASTCSASA